LGKNVAGYSFLDIIDLTVLFYFIDFPLFFASLFYNWYVFFKYCISLNTQTFYFKVLIFFIFSFFILTGNIFFLIFLIFLESLVLLEFSSSSSFSFSSKKSSFLLSTSYLIKLTIFFSDITNFFSLLILECLPYY